MSSAIRDIQDIDMLRHYHLDRLNLDQWVEEEDLPAWVHEEDHSVTSPKPTPARAGRGAGAGNNMDADDAVISETIDLLGLVKGNILKTKNVRGDAHLVSSAQKSFNAQRYLTTIHAETSYDDLVQGVQRLRGSMDQRSSALKVLVQNNFDRFVSAKNVIDSVYDDMKQKTLTEDQDFGTFKLNSILRESYGKAHEVINPVLERREKIDKLRSTVGLLEPYRLFFNLPFTLQESIKQGKYQQATRDYNKGKVLLAQAFPTPSSAASGTSAGSGSAVALETKRKVFDIVWAEVLRIVAGLRAELEAELEEPWRGMEEHERNIKMLYELDTPTDPVWHCLSSQYRWITKMMTESYDEQYHLLDLLRRNDDIFANQDMTPTQRCNLFKKIMEAIQSTEFEIIFAKEPEVKVWMAVLSVVKTLSDLLLRLLPDFWKLATAFMEGKLQKNPKQQQRRTGGINGADPAKVQQCQTMAKEIVELYSTQVSHVLIRSLTTPVPPAIQEQADRTAQESGEEQGSAPVIKAETAIITGFFLGKIMTELCNCVNDINGVRIHGGAFQILADLTSEVRWKFVTTLCDIWGEDAKVFYRHEDWSINATNAQITQFVGLFYQFHEYSLRSAYKYASIWAATSEDSQPSDEAGATVPKHYLEMIQKTFLDALYSFLDGLVHLAFADPEQGNGESGGERRGSTGDLVDRSAGRSGGAGGLVLVTAKKPKKIDITQLDSRILLTISNLSELKSVLIPRLLNDFDRISGVSIHEDGQTLVDVVNQLDNILFEDYIKRKTVALNQIITDGILYGGIDWYSISRPTGVHSFMIEALLQLVLVHAQISEIAAPLVHRSLSALFVNMAQDCLTSFRQVERFGMGGMLQATLEVEFMNLTLSQYVSPMAKQTLLLIYKAVEDSYQPPAEGGGDLQNELAGVKQLLSTARSNTHVQFVCFRKK